MTIDIKIYNWSKDPKGIFQSCNEEMAQVADEISPHRMIGKRDDQFIWRNRSHIYQVSDYLAIKNGVFKCYECLKTNIGDRKVIITKAQLLNKQGKIIGTIGSAIDITNQVIIDKLGHFDNDGGLYFKYNGVSEYFTKYEVKVLKELLKGKSARQIAEKLLRSIRTIEDHILAVRRKLECKNKNDIISKAIELNLIYLCFEDNR